MRLRELARVVSNKLRRRHRRLPATPVLQSLFEAAYAASLHAEEGRPTICTLTFLDPDNPDPDPPQRIVADRWTCTPLPEQVEVTVRNLVKLSHASDPYASSLAVCSREADQWVVWGMIDQSVHMHRYVRHEAARGPFPPGVFTLHIEGIGSLAVYHGYQLLAALRADSIVMGGFNVLRAGPIAHKLAFDSFAERVRASVGSETFDARDHWPVAIKENWVSAVSRILLAIQRKNHGATLIWRGGPPHGGLAFNYRLNYDRLSGALHDLAVATIKHVYARDQIFERYLDRDGDLISADLYLEEAVNVNTEDEVMGEVSGCAAFIASLSQVDGALLLSRNWSVRGFGVEIKTAREPERVMVAGDEEGTPANLRAIDQRLFGTRHRSAIRYAWYNGNSVCFVVSQDGGVRALTRHGDQVVLWENVNLLKYSYASG